MQDESKLRAQFERLRVKLNAIAEKKNNANARKLLGKYFKYRNSYSLPESDADYWWLYAHVFSVEGGYGKALQFQTDKYGKISIETEQYFHARERWIEIDRAEFEANFNKPES